MDRIFFILDIDVLGQEELLFLFRFESIYFKFTKAGISGGLINFTQNQCVSKI